MSLAVRILRIVAIAAMSAPFAIAQDELGDIQRELAQLRSPALRDWRFHMPDVPGAERPDFDDSAWRLVSPQHSFPGPNTKAWYRKWIVIPERIGGFPLAGKAVGIRVGIDDEGELYVNGDLKQRFHWDQGRAVLTENAAPGQRFLVAIRAINGPGNGRLLSASLDIPALDELAQPVAPYLDQLGVAATLVRSHPENERWAEAARAASRALDREALHRGDAGAFVASIGPSLEALKPLAEGAKQYRLYLVGHAHIDMNWLWLWPETIQVCHDTWAQALRFMDEYPQFKFSQSQPAAYVPIQTQYPDLFAEIQRRASEGRWELTGGTWVESDMNMPSGEALVRQCLNAREYCLAHFGKAPEIGWLPDTFGHAWTVPEILSGCGLKYYYFCRAGKGAPLFWWEGPDGSRLLAYSFGGYADRIDGRIGLRPMAIERAVGVKDAMIVYGVGDHGGGPTRQDIEAALRLQKLDVFPTAEFSTASDFYEDALAERRDYPVIRDELNTVFEGCYTSHGDIKKENRTAENTLPVAELWSALAMRYGYRYPASDLTRAWRNVCFNQFHDLLAGTAIHDSYKYCTQLYDEAMAAGGSALDGALTAIGRQIDTRGSGIPIVVFNPLGWERDDYVEATLVSASRPPRIWLSDASDCFVPTQVVAQRQQGAGWATTFGFVARQVPSCGYTVYHALVQAPPGMRWPAPFVRPADRVKVGSLAQGPNPAAIACGRFVVDVDTASGTIRQIRDRVAQRDVLQADGDQLQVLFESPHGMSAWTIGAVQRTLDLRDRAKVRLLEAGPVRTVIAIRHPFRNSSFVQKVCLYADLPRIDFQMRANWQDAGRTGEEAPMIKVAFPVALKDAAATFEIPYGSIERPANGAEVPAQKWIDLTEYRYDTGGGGSSTPYLPVDLGAYFSNDGLATAGEPADGDFDYGGCNFPAEALPAGDTVSAGGVPFIRPPTDAGAANNIACGGQSITLPKAEAASIVVLGAATNGNKAGTLTLRYADGSQRTTDLAFSDWCSVASAGEVEAFGCDHRYGRTGVVPPRCSLWMQRIPADPDRRLTSIVLPRDRNLHIFAITLGPPVLRTAVYGVSLLNNAKYGHDVMGSTMRLTLLRASYDPDPRPDVGIHEFTYSLYPHVGDWRAAGTVRRAYELNTPMVVRIADRHAGRLPSRYSFIRVSPDNLVLGAVKKAEHSDDLVLRLYETNGSRVQAQLWLAQGGRYAMESNHVEVNRAGSRAGLYHGHMLEVPIGPHQVETVKVRR